MTYSVKENGPASATLSVTHTCGHTSELSYGGKVYAEADGPYQERQACGTCRNSAIVAANQKEREERERKK